MSTYSDKLKDPRWQKMRLKILERDGWKCQDCETTTETLHVHHKAYLPNRDPWDYPEWMLVTLCQGCHEYEPDRGHVEDLATLMMQVFIGGQAITLFPALLYALESGVTTENLRKAIEDAAHNEVLKVRACQDKKTQIATEPPVSATSPSAKSELQTTNGTQYA